MTAAISQLATKGDLKTEIKELEVRLLTAINSSTNRLITIITIVIAIASFFIKFH